MQESADFMIPSGGPSLLVIVKPFTPAPAEHYQRGARVATVEAGRHMPQAKTINYLTGQLAFSNARARDPEIVEVLYVDLRGNVTEGIVSNVFAFVGDALVTPAKDVLYGITRQVVLELAEPRFKIEQRELPLAELHAADEAFITGSAKEIMPVRAIDGERVGSSAPGPRTLQLMEDFRAMARRFAAAALKGTAA